MVTLRPLSLEIQPLQLLSKHSVSDHEVVDSSRVCVPLGGGDLLRQQSPGLQFPQSLSVLSASSGSWLFGKSHLLCPRRACFSRRLGSCRAETWFPIVS